MKFCFGVMAACLMASGLVQAQERTAAGSLDTQVTWSALKGLVDNANAKSDGALQQLGKVAECGKLGKVYAPGDPESTNGCKAADAASMGLFVVRAGYDAGSDMTFKFNLSDGTAAVTSSHTYGNRYLMIPKLDYDTICNGKTKHTIDLLSINQWYGMPMAAGHKLDETVNFGVLQQPTCANGLTGIAKLYDNEGSLANDEWSMGAVIMFKTE